MAGTKLKSATKVKAARSPKRAAGPARARGAKVRAGKGATLRVRANYDAAQDGDDNRKHWQNAEFSSANVLNDPSTRQTLRDRARFEVRNNSHAYGLVESLANDLVGTGPRLQLTIPPDNVEVGKYVDQGATPERAEQIARATARRRAREIETLFANWAAAADLAEDLRLLHRTRVRDGEAFALLIDNPRLPECGRTAVTLDLAIYEAEQVADPFYWHFYLDPTYDDGIKRDLAGNPVQYTFLKTHPGGVASWLALHREYFPASRVLHWFKPDRPGQARGISTLAPGLNIYAQLRRFSLAVLGAAEVHAMITGVLKTNLPPVDGAPVEVSTMDEVEFARNALLTLPAGSDAEAFTSTQPGPNFKEFRTEMLNELGRAASVPRNVMTGSSAEYNYSSCRADFLLFFRVIKVERSRMRAKILDRLFLAWVQEAALARAIPAALPPVASWTWEWHWDGFESVDPLKDAQTDETELRNGTTTLQDIYARKGQDWEEKTRQRARERQLLRELNLPESGLHVTERVAPGQDGTDANANETQVAQAAA